MSSLMRLFYPQWQGSDNPQLHEAALALYKLLPQPWGMSVAVTRDLKPIAHGINHYAALRKQHSLVTQLLGKQRPDRLLTLGGDCNTAILPVNYLHGRYPDDLVLIWIDQHADLNTPASSPSADFHGMPVRHILGDGEATLRGTWGQSLSPERVIYVGAGQFDPDERATIERHHMTVLGIAEITEDANLLGRVIRRKGAAHAYVHVDTDCLDAREFDGTLYPNPRGLFLDELMALLTQVSEQAQIVGATLTSYSTKDAQQLQRLIPLLNRLDELVMSDRDKDNRQ